MIVGNSVESCRVLARHEDRERISDNLLHPAFGISHCLEKGNGSGGSPLERQAQPLEGAVDERRHTAAIEEFAVRERAPIVRISVDMDLFVGERTIP
jgi:hypothetical protein